MQPLCRLYQLSGNRGMDERSDRQVHASYLPLLPRLSRQRRSGLHCSHDMKLHTTTGDSKISKILKILKDGTAGAGTVARRSADPHYPSDPLLVGRCHPGRNFRHLKKKKKILGSGRRVKVRGRPASRLPRVKVRGRPASGLPRVKVSGRPASGLPRVSTAGKVRGRPASGLPRVKVHGRPG